MADQYKNHQIHPEKLSSFLLIGATLFALILNNSSLSWLYDSLLTVPLAIQVADLNIAKPLLLWINDGLMAVFFFLIGLEIKREILVGELSTRKKASLPIMAAIGGIVVPAGLYYMLNVGDTEALRGWAVPVATDIAFALGILALLGDKLPKEIKILLLSLAIIDDLAAILIIAVFYTADLSFEALGLASIGLAGAIALNRFGIKKIAPYILIGIFMWVCVLKSGVHATLAGVVLAFCIPLTGKKGDCPVESLEHALHPWVFFFIMPIFAFANAGIDLTSMTLASFNNTITLGIIAGLFIGKQVGVFGFIWIAIKTGLCEKPKTLNWLHLYGLSLLTGIGFTMSLFIGMLAFDNLEITSQVRAGVLTASFMSAMLGYFVLRLTLKKGCKSKEA